MSFCFLAGSDGRRLLVQDAVEYIEFASDGRVQLVADFFVRNDSDESARLYLIHPFDVEFRDGSREWCEFPAGPKTLIARAIMTTFYEAFVVQSGGAVQTTSGWPKEYDESVVFRVAEEAGFEEVPGDLDGPASRPERRRILGARPIIPPSQTATRSRIPFSGIMTAEIAPSERQLIRVAGSLRHQGEIPEIAGEARLVDRIAQDMGVCSDNYSRFLARFRTDLWSPIQRYHFAINVASERGELKVNPVTPDLNPGFERRKIDGKVVTWYWATSPQLEEPTRSSNGPLLSVAAC